ncbi:hypothetical protein [Polyangium spumosum]|uniref:Uncharacterized protein n=1 Tax=Polyangium spumosum TaxID=889282 RepID=A0A6N7PQJ5_9BACT|nr:hypothetical protein [Polyangium spumosum]MRG94199.1 hypothetical protein [Polyangium spumosum]
MSDTYLIHLDDKGNAVRTPITPEQIPTEDEQRRLIEVYKARGLLLWWSVCADGRGVRVTVEDEHAAVMVPIFRDGRVAAYVNESRVATLPCV